MSMDQFYLGVISSLAATAIGFFGGFFWKTDIARKIRKAFNCTWPFIVLIFCKKRTIYFYIDTMDKGEAAKKIIERLSPIMEKQARFKEIIDPNEFLIYPLNPFLTRAVIVLVTDVTTLSAEKERLEKIQQSISKYSSAGGTVILGHDALYRRSKNEIFQEMAGGTLKYFSKNNGRLTYNINTDNSRLSQEKSKGLIEKLNNKKYQLSDGEYLYSLEGWKPEVDFIYVTEHQTGVASTQVPLVTRKETRKGCVYWINSGDNDGTGLPKSMGVPEADFVEMLGKILDFED